MKKNNNPESKPERPVRSIKGKPSQTLPTSVALTAGLILSGLSAIAQEYHSNDLTPPGYTAGLNGAAPGRRSELPRRAAVRTQCC